LFFNNSIFTVGDKYKLFTLEEVTKLLKGNLLYDKNELLRLNSSENVSRFFMEIAYLFVIGDDKELIQAQMENSTYFFLRGGYYGRRARSCFQRNLFF